MVANCKQQARNGPGCAPAGVAGPEIPMPTLHVRDVPKETYEGLQALAKASGRSLTTEVIEQLKQVVDKAAARRRGAEAIEAIARMPPLRLPDGMTSLDVLDETRAEFERRHDRP